MEAPPISVFRSRLVLIPLAAVLASAGCVAACGGGGGSGSPAAPSVRARKTPSRPCTIAHADIDGDGAVSIFDVKLVSQHMGEKVPPAPQSVDQDGDGVITVLDLNLVTSVFVRSVDDCP
jgi:hypothetical protein